ncbi:hypothetical protein V8B97DRAFT_1668707 [Scleroderma yunnanense]
MSTNGTTIAHPNSVNLQPHLAAQKYFFACTLTVLLWDTLVLSPRSYKLGRAKIPWPAFQLKVLYYFLQFWVVADFLVTGMMFFSASVTQDPDCLRFWPYEPICTAILLFAASTVHVIRISAIYSHDHVRSIMSSLLLMQAIVTSIFCGFYRAVRLHERQGCIAGPLNNQSWVGIYWLFPTILYGTSFVLAVSHSFKTRESCLNIPRRMLRDNLNLYGIIFLVNLVNVFFYFIMEPTGPDDPIKTIVSSMAGVLTATVTMRIILGACGSLETDGSRRSTGRGNGYGVTGSTSGTAVSGTRASHALTSHQRRDIIS